MSELLTKMSIHDRPMRQQGKIMSLIHSTSTNRMLRTLPDRMITVVRASAQAPHLISISAGGDTTLDLPNDVITTALALRLGIPQTNTSPSTGAAGNTKHRCPACGHNHLSEHFEESLSCGPGGTALRTRWHDDITYNIYLMAKALGIPCAVEPQSVATDSNRRCDVRLSRLSRRHADLYVDANTYIHTKPADTFNGEANFPGMVMDAHEAKKIKYHQPAIAANEERDEFVPFVLNEHGVIGPMGMEMIDNICKRAPDPVAFKTYWMRRMHATTARHVHRIMHGRVRGHVSPHPAEDRANDTSRLSPTAEDMAEQTVCANDADITLSP